tara:strand:+ start:668 stop:1327 length:660 start_codon:yes stop_codon:yes gene_type:complete
MATVRFSGELRNDIINKAKSLFSDRDEKARKNYPDTWGQTIYDLVFQDNKIAMQSLPKSYFRNNDEVSIRGFGGQENVWSTSDNYTVSMKLTTPLPIPNEIVGESHGLVGEARTYGGWYLNPSDPRWDTFKAEYKKYCDAIRKIEDERKVFIAGVNTIMDTYSTLAPAIKAWPPLWDLVPYDKQERHKQIVDRKKKEVVVEGVDLASMTATSALAKFTK